MGVLVESFVSGCFFRFGCCNRMRASLVEVVKRDHDASNPKNCFNQDKGLCLESLRTSL